MCCINVFYSSSSAAAFLAGAALALGAAFSTTTLAFGASSLASVFTSTLAFGASSLGAAAASFSALRSANPSDIADVTCVKILSIDLEASSFAGIT